MYDDPEEVRELMDEAEYLLCQMERIISRLNLRRDDKDEYDNWYTRVEQWRLDRRLARLPKPKT